MTQMEEFLVKKKSLFILLTAGMVSATSCAVDVGSLPIDKIPIETGQDTKTNLEIDMQAKAQELYDIARDVYFKMLYTRQGFMLAEYNDIYSEIVSGGIFGDVTSKEDVKRQMREVFAEPIASQYDAMIEEYFTEENGKLYTYVNGKGGNVLFESVDLVPVSFDGNSAEFNAVAHYSGYEDISRPFSIVCEDSTWKVSEFSDPNCEPLETVSTTAPEDNSDDNAEITAMAFEIYQKVHRMSFHILTNGTYYETNGNFIIDETGIQHYEISDNRVSCIDDIYSELAMIFSSNFISEHDDRIEYLYTEADGKLYQVNQGKGSVIDYDTAKLQLVYSDDCTLQFDVYNYLNGNPITGQFTLIYENGGWKVNTLD